MEKPIGAPARGRRAWQPQHLAAARAGPPLVRVTPNKGARKLRDWSLAPGTATHRGLAIVYLAGTCEALRLAT